MLPEPIGRALREGHDDLHAWSSGCASGEEPYTLRICWELECADGPSVEVIGSDRDSHMIERAERAMYDPSSLEDLPSGWRETAFEPHEDDAYDADQTNY